MLSCICMRPSVLIPMVAFLVFSCLTASAQTVPSPGGTPVSVSPGPVGATSPVNGAAPHVGNSVPQVVPTPPTVTQPSVANNGAQPGEGDVLASSVSSPTTPAAWVRQTIPVAPCRVPPKIDGRLDDACWRTATRASGFFRLGGASPIDPANQTEAWICADSTHLYVAFHCLDAHPELMHASQTQRDGSIGEDDYVGVDVDSQNAHHGLSTSTSRRAGHRVRTWKAARPTISTWAGDWKAATARTKDGWTAEMSIPFALMRYSKGASAFGLNLFRKLAP